MNTAELEARLAALEQDVAELRQKLSETPDPRRRWWFEDAGRFADDPLFEEMVRLGRKYRESQRPKAKEPTS